MQKRRKAKKRPAYVLNQYTFTKKKSGKLESSQAEVKQYLRETHTDSLREDSMGDCERLTGILSLRHVNPWYQDVSTLTCSDISPHILNIFNSYIYLFQPLFLRLDFFHWRIYNVHESFMLIISIPTHLFRRETFQDSPTILSTPVKWPNYYTKLSSITKTWQWYGLI